MDEETRCPDDCGWHGEHEHCTTEGCDGVDSFYRYVVDYVSCSLDGETGEYEGGGDSGQLAEESQGIFCENCDAKVG